MNSYLRCTDSGGFTLVELLIVISIFAISLSVAVPNFQELLLNNAKSEMTNTYRGALALARSHAVSYRKIAAICPLDADSNCTDDWNLPVSVFPDSNRDRKPDNDEIWRVIPKPNNRFSVHSRTGGSGVIHFGPDGIVHGRTGSVVICPQDLSSRQMTYLAVSRGGRARQVSDEDGDGVIKLSWGGRITCP